MSPDIPYVFVALCTMIYVFLRSFQQLNVTQARYVLILPISLLMGATDVYLIGRAALSAAGGHVDPWMMLAYGFGGGIGSIIAIWTHNRFFGSKS